MKVWKQDGGGWVQATTLSEALAVDFSAHQVIAAVGGGGKTSVLHRLADELSAAGRKVILTTSSHMLMPESEDLLANDPDIIRHKLANGQYALVGYPAENGKMKGVPRDQFAALCSLADIILVEADGSRQLPLKLPAAYEPDIPENTTHVLVLAGMRALGRKICDTCHRVELVTELLAVDLAHVVTPADIARLIRQGYWLPHVTGKCRTGTVILNQADNTGRHAGAVQVAALLAPLPCLITQLKETT